MILSPAELAACLPFAQPARVALFAPHLDAAAVEFEINTPRRLAAWIAQIGHESGSLRYVREIASGAAYEGRADLGNTIPGDGTRFRGRGLIQITGRRNYTACTMALFNDPRLLGAPELLEEPANACRSAGWFWASRGLNALADADRFELITRRINGGLNGQADRLAHWARCKTALGVRL